MPFDVVMPILGTCFVSAWVFIGGMMVRDSLDRAREIRFDSANEPHRAHFH
ncbi:hypothetical protein [Aeoliella sp.]|uniref:hypothetical protein n=1 Tax=Aeoliella sp. TaxID=2795800 RepID=UPI003CCBDC00